MKMIQSFVSLTWKSFPYPQLECCLLSSSLQPLGASCCNSQDGIESILVFAMPNQLFISDGLNMMSIYIVWYGT
jgi:hypothetical protein